MDRLNQLKGESGGSRDLTLDTSSPPSESFMTANESSSKYFSLSEVDSTFDVSPSKDSALSTRAVEEETLKDSELISNLSPIPKKVDSFQIGKQIEAANILSGGVNIFDDNDNSYDGDELVIDDNVPVEESGKTDEEQPFQKNTDSVENSANVAEAIPSIDTEVVLQIDGKNVNAIAIGNGLYLYRKGEEELAAIQMVDDNQHQPSFKFLKVRDNAEGNLEVYEEIEVEVPNKVPAKEGKAAEKKSNVPVKETSVQVKDANNDKLVDNKIDTSVSKSSGIANTDIQSESKSEVNFNGKKVKLNESRKSPLISTFTPMAYHSTPNKEGIPLTKTMVDQQLHPNRQSDIIKKTIEVHTDLCKRESPVKDKECETIKPKEIIVPCLDKKETKSEIFFDVQDEKQVENINNSKIVEIEKNVNANEKSTKLLNSVILQNKISDECEKLLENNLETNVKDNIFNSNEASHKKNNINSSDTKLESLNRINIDEELNSSDICKSNSSNEIIMPITETIPLPIKSEMPLLLDDANLKLGKTKSTHETDKSELERKNFTLKDEIIRKEKDTLQKSDGFIEKVKMNAKTDQKVDIFENDKVADIEFDKNNDIENNIKISRADNTQQLPENVIKNNIEPPKDDIQCQNLTDCNKSINNEILNDDNLLNKTLATQAHLETVKPTINFKSHNDIDLSQVQPQSENLNQTKDPSISTKLQKTDVHKSDCKVEDKGNINKKPTKQIYNIGNVKEKQNEAVDGASKNEPIKEVYNATERSSSNTVVTTVEYRAKTVTENPTEIPRVDNVSDNIIKSQNDLEFKKEDPTSVKEIIQLQSETKQSISATKVKPAGPKPINYSAVPFGKWTEANRQEFLNKIKETKIPGNISNTKQLKQPNDLNRRDVLKKIDTQRQAHLLTAKNQETGAHTKASVIGDSTAVFVNKSIPTLKRNDNQIKNTIPETESNKNKPLTGTISFEEKYIEKNESLNTTNLNKTPARRKEINNQDLIDKTIEGIISRAVSTKPHEEWKQIIKMDAAETLKHHNSIVSLDDIEKKMNELHGIPFVERPAHELPQVHIENTCEIPKDAKSNIPQHHPFKNNKEKNIAETISDEEIIEHQPVTGDMTGQNEKIYQYQHEKLVTEKTNVNEENKNDTIITERDFDKFARRNSITYENCLTVKFDGRESHNVIQTLVEKEVPSKKLNRNEMMLAESKAKSTNKHLRHHVNTSKSALSTKATSEEDSYNKNYQSQSKVQMAYQSALTAKRQLECPVTLLEDKPVKVVFLESGSDFASTTLNVQGQELSPSKKTVLDSDSQSASESLDSDVIDSPCEAKLQDETRSKSKHQRKQVLTPVDIPELELIEPIDLGINDSPKKRKKMMIDETKERTKSIAPKKSYLLNRAPTHENTSAEGPEIRLSESGSDSKPFVVHSDAISAIDNLVKAAELIETQSEKKAANAINLPESDASPINTPIKRGRGRPRKYPLSETSQQINKTPSPIKPRLIDSNMSKVVESDDSDSNEEFIKENWTMGKINENIVCPICNKLFRSENVVFKHVKHCTGPSPNRSESSRSLKKYSLSEGKSDDSDSNISDDSDDDKPIKPKVKITKSVQPKKEDVILIEDTPQKKISEEVTMKGNSKPATLLPKSDHLVCEFCGKTFRQLSYLVNHKQQHKNDEKKLEKQETHKSIFSCEVCKKEFRKLHHLVQHRIIHNPNTMTSKLSRKYSYDRSETSSVTVLKTTKQDEDQSAGFRCEPCDKSFRKLHHLVEHRETHDGINKKGSSTNGLPSNDVLKPSANHVCGFCKKTFKKLQQLTEHRDQHCDACSEKSDDVKSVKSSLSTKDIIHECSLCYMVFPNEHSLNKHTIICLKKKKQSAAKQVKLLEQKANGQEILGDEDKLSESDIQNQSDKDCETEPDHKDDITNKPIEKSETVTPRIEVCDDKQKVCESKIERENIKTDEVNIAFDKVGNATLKRNIKEEQLEKSDDNSGKKHGKIRKIEVITIPDTPTPKKKVKNAKEKRASTETKKPKSTLLKLELNKEKTLTDVSDDDEIRYMLNPNMKEDVPEEKVFMKVRANKRSSLQFERPNSKELVKRRISLQNPPKVQRSKIKLSEKPKSDKTSDIQVKTEQTDSDDSDVKYSFPENTVQSNKKENMKTAKKELTVANRKSITGIARRKSLPKHKIPVPSQKIKRRRTEVEHRCDCGQLFSSAALLSRHTTLAHTPPRVRRPRDPPPDKPQKKGQAAPAEKRKTPVEQPKVVTQQKKSATNSNVVTVKTRKCVVDNKSSGKVVKSETNSKTLRSAAHKGVPVPDKMKRFMDKYK